jgi:hypothetical protein
MCSPLAQRISRDTGYDLWLNFFFSNFSLSSSSFLFLFYSPRVFCRRLRAICIITYFLSEKFWQMFTILFHDVIVFDGDERELNFGCCGVEMSISPRTLSECWWDQNEITLLYGNISARREMFFYILCYYWSMHFELHLSGYWERSCCSCNMLLRCDASNGCNCVAVTVFNRV